MREVFYSSALVAALLLWAGCAAGPRPSSAGGSPSSRADRPVREEFDPRSVSEDLLLIPPSFARPRAGTSSQPAPEPLGPPEATVLETAPATPVVEPEPVWGTAYRVQIMALRSEEMARQSAAELAQDLGQAVTVEPQRDFFVVRVGTFGDRSEAESLKERLADRDSDYAGAFVVEVEAAAALDADADAAEPADESPPLPVEPEPTLVPAFGWRVLLHQFLDYPEADRFRKDAVRRLGRRDVQVIFKAPWYKVEFGNFRTEIEAQQWVEDVRDEFKNALKVRGQILVPEEDQ